MSMQSRTFGQFAKETRERRLANVRARIYGGTYETQRKLDATVEAMADREDFTSHPPVLRADDAAMNDWMDEQMQGLCETDK